MNRLNLDFSLESGEERSKFLHKYLINSKLQNLTPTELETISNYLLWGKDKDGLNCNQKKEIQIDTKNKTWTRRPEESLNALIESPTFNENQVRHINSTPLKVKKQKFSREEALKEATPELQKTFLSLFKQIDELELLLNFYDLKTGKRKLPPRPELLSRIDEEKQLSLKEKATSLNQFSYLKLRHRLVELRTEQYTLRDNYSTPVLVESFNLVITPEEIPKFGVEIPVFPLGFQDNSSFSQLIFKPFSELRPSVYSEDELRLISSFYWKLQDQRKNQNFFDFKNPDHLYGLFTHFYEVYDSIILEDIEETSPFLFKTLKFYLKEANLPDYLYQILDLKLKKIPNQKIADFINQKFQKTYTANYISTLFKQKIIGEINAAAAYHEELIRNLFFPENFKDCRVCGRTFLISTKNYCRKSRSKDGFSNRCKECDKDERNRKKLKFSTKTN